MNPVLKIMYDKADLIFCDKTNEQIDAAKLITNMSKLKDVEIASILIGKTSFQGIVLDLTHIGSNKLRDVCKQYNRTYVHIVYTAEGGLSIDTLPQDAWVVTVNTVSGEIRGRFMVQKLDLDTVSETQIQELKEVRNYFTSKRVAEIVAHQLNKIFEETRT